MAVNHLIWLQEPHLGPVQGQEVLLAAESSLQLLILKNILFCVRVCVVCAHARKLTMSKDNLQGSVLSFYHTGPRIKLRSLAFAALMLLPVEPSHLCRFQNFKHILFYFLARNTLDTMGKIYKTCTQGERHECGARTGCRASSRLARTTE